MNRLRLISERQSNEREMMESSSSELFKRINAGTPMDISPQMVDSSIRFLFDYATSCYSLLNSMQFQLIGYFSSIVLIPRHEDVGGVSLELHRCPSCFTYRDNRLENNIETPHDPKCALNALLLK